MLPADAVSRLLELFPPLNRAAQQISLHLYRLLAQGDPVALERLAAAARLDEASVTRTVNEWPGVFHDEAGCVIGYWGLTLRPMAHRLRANGRALYTWCAWDSLFIPELIKADVQVESACPVTQGAIRLSVTSRGVALAEPAGVVMSMLVPDAQAVAHNLITHFCHYVHFFSSQEAGTAWVARNPGTFLLSLAEAQALSRFRNAALYPSL